jgi:hypothetical protein
MIVKIRQIVSRISQSLLSRLAALIKYVFASIVVVFTRNKTVVDIFRITGTGLGLKMDRACYRIRSPKET